MTTDRDNVFANVDASGVAPQLIAYLEHVATVPAMREADAISYELLALAPGMSVLEVGCGLGDDARGMAERVAPGGRVTAVDYSEAMVATARERNGDVVDVRVGDIRALDFPDGTFDATRAERVLQHVADPAAAARELVRVTKAGGRVVLIDTDWSTLAIDLPDAALLDRVQEHGRGMGTSPTAGRSLRRWLAAAGVVDVVVRPVTFVATSLAEGAGVLPMLNEGIPAEHGMLPADIRDDWFAALHENDRTGGFCAAVTLFVAGGRKAATAVG